MTEPAKRSRLGLVGWIPDFQHKHLPQLFSAAEIRQRDKQHRALAERCHRIVVSSESVLADFNEQHPQHAAKARVLPFPSQYAFRAPSTDGPAVARKYHLPPRFLLCANQFWAHKNHLLLLDALTLLAETGLRIPVAFTGLLSDYRDPANGTVNAFLMQTARRGVHDIVHVLGLVPRADLDGLLRAAAAVVQPSASEGWSTVIQDARALGRPTLCSKIPVLQEQASDAAGFFDLNAADMAHVLAEFWCTPPRPTEEERSLARERDFAERHGRSLLAICRDAAEVAGR